MIGYEKKMKNLRSHANSFSNIFKTRLMLHNAFDFLNMSIYYSEFLAEIAFIKYK